MRLYDNPTFKGGYMAVQGALVVLFDRAGQAYSAEAMAFSPLAKSIDINKISKHVAGSILKTSYWRINR